MTSQKWDLPPARVWLPIGVPGFSLGGMKFRRQVRAIYFCSGPDAIDWASWISVHLRLASEKLVLNRGPVVTQK